MMKALLVDIDSKFPNLALIFFQIDFNGYVRSR